MADTLSSRLLHDNAVRVKPPGQNLKPSTFWVAILKIDKEPTGNNTEEDFLWIKSPGKITAQTIHFQYDKTCAPAEKWVLKHGSSPVNLQATVAELDVYRDRVVVFEAVKMSNADRLPSRQPLQPTNTQVLSPPDKSQASQNLPGVKMPILAPQNLIPRPLDENSIFQRKSFLPRVHTDRSQLPANVRSNTNAPSSITLHGPSPNVSHQSSSALRVEPHPPLSKVPSPATQVIPPARQASIPMHFSNTPSSVSSPDTAQLRAAQVDSYLGSESRAKENPQNNPSLDEPPVSSSEVDDQHQKTFQLQTLLKDASPQMLEASVEQGVKLLDRLKGTMLEKLPNSVDAEQWIQQIDNLRNQATKTKTVIGVVGNTGAGKSSVINAMLDEERLVPTNCMRACTAVVTEISFNHEQEPYRAHIEFVSQAEWERELKIMFDDLLDSNGQVSRDCANEDTDAGIAWQKIKAVYPKKTKEDIAKSSTATLLQEVSHVLGTTRDVKDTDSLRFYKKLQRFVDSQEKATGLKDKENKRKEPKEMEFWPLIRVVRIYVKSPALATGAVIVDLPGVHDANAARAAVAEGYMKQCTGLWIVAPINRAVDDKAAKSLLGESFKRQLKMDGGFNSITFICSKTDDISLEEAQDSLGLDDEMAPYWAEIDELSKTQKTKKTQLKELKETKTIYGEVLNDIDEQLDEWQVLKDKLEEGKSVVAPKSKGARKRKSGVKDKSRKKQRWTIGSDDEDVEDSDHQPQSVDSEEDEQTEEDNAQEPLKEDQIITKLQELRTAKKEARLHKMEITENIMTLRQQIEEAEEAQQKIESKLSALCISGRNRYSKGAIQQDFAAGIKELDQELADEEDEANFDPEAEVRDYEEVARGLPVFCVSSRGYQKLKGRLRKDPKILGFTTIEETEIPQLQAHCEQLTEAGRSAKCRTFINKLSQLLNSLSLWASNDGSGANMTGEQRAREARYLQTGLSALESGLEKAVRTTCKEIGGEFTDNIFDKYKTAISNAVEDAIGTALKWGSPVNRENRAEGGVAWSTYKAICRRNGTYVNAQGPHEWNIALVNPMIKVLASGWEKTFTRRLPMAMATFVRNTSSMLRDFHREVEDRARKSGTGIAGLSTLQQQATIYETLFKDLATIAKNQIDTCQKDINREFIRFIENAMSTAYEQCVNERGAGCYARMKALMNTHVAQERHVMFQESAENVRNKLVDLVREVEELMKDKADEVFINIKRDYRVALGGHDVQRDGEMLPRTQRIVRKEIKHILDGVEEAFIIAVGLETKEDDRGKEDPDGGDMDVEGSCDGSDDNALNEELNLSPKTNTTLPGQVADTEGAQTLDTAASAREAVAGGAYIKENSDMPSSTRGLKLEEE